MRAKLLNRAMTITGVLINDSRNLQYRLRSRLVRGIYQHHYCHCHYHYYIIYDFKEDQISPLQVAFIKVSNVQFVFLIEMTPYILLNHITITIFSNLIGALTSLFFTNYCVAL